MKLKAITNIFIKPISFVLFICVFFQTCDSGLSVFAESTHCLSPRIQLDSMQTAISAGQQVSLYFSWHTYATLIKNNTIFPTNPDLVNQFYANPSRYPLIEKVFNQANKILNINFYDYLQGDLASKSRTNVLLAHILFCYGFAEQWQSTFKGSIKKVTFTSGGVFAALLFEKVITLNDALPFIRDFYDYFWPRTDIIAKQNNIYSAALRTNTDENISTLIETIIRNSKLNNVFIKELRWNNEVIISGSKEQVATIIDIFKKAGNSKFAKRHHFAHIYKDAAIHIPLMTEPSWFKARIKGFKLDKPKHSIVGTNFEISNKPDPEIMAEFLRSAYFDKINTVGSFTDLDSNSKIILAIGIVKLFIKKAPEISNKTFILTSPQQTILFEKTVKKPTQSFKPKEETKPIPTKTIALRKIKQNFEELIEIGI